MKITRSALKSLIKEEMNRIGEAGDRVAGDDPSGMYAFEGMSNDERIAALKALVTGVGDSQGITVEGLDDLQNARRRLKFRRDKEEKHTPSIGVNVRHHKPPSSRYSDSTDRTAWATATFNTKNLPGKFPDIEEAVAAFNSQNGGKGGQVKHGGTDQFNFMSSDEEIPFAKGGPSAWL
jgi:hypothetical protein